MKASKLTRTALIVSIAACLTGLLPQSALAEDNVNPPVPLTGDGTNTGGGGDSEISILGALPKQIVIRSTKRFNTFVAPDYMPIVAQRKCGFLNRKTCYTFAEKVSIDATLALSKNFDPNYDVVLSNYFTPYFELQSLRGSYYAEGKWHPLEVRDLAGSDSGMRYHVYRIMFKALGGKYSNGVSLDASGWADFGHYDGIFEDETVVDGRKNTSVSQHYMSMLNALIQQTDFADSKQVQKYNYVVTRMHQSLATMQLSWPLEASADFFYDLAQVPYNQGLIKRVKKDSANFLRDGLALVHADGSCDQGGYHSLLERLHAWTIGSAAYYAEIDANYSQWYDVSQPKQETQLKTIEMRQLLQRELADKVAKYCGSTGSGNPTVDALIND